MAEKSFLVLPSHLIPLNPAAKQGSS